MKHSYLPPMISPKNSSFKISVGIRNATDFSPFGVELKGRNFEVVGGGNYRFGFNGMEADNDVKGEGNSYDFGARMLDPRLGRWLSIDSKAMNYPDWTPYKYALDDPLNWIDIDGNEEFPTYADYIKWAEKNKKTVLSHEQMYNQGHWLFKDRSLYDTEGQRSSSQAMCYRHANYRNLLKNDASQYKNLIDRMYFYNWADNYFSGQGHEIQWMGAATSTIMNLYLLHSDLATSAGFSNNEINQFIERGNKIILDDMMSKIKSLDKVKPIKGADALKWDAQALSDEQNLIQKEYNKLSEESISLLQSNLETFEGFQGDIKNAADRWVYGMKKMGYDVTKDMMPKPDSNYKKVKLSFSNTGKVEKK